MTSLPGKNPTEHGNRISRPYRREESSASSWAARMFCCLPIPRGRGLGRAHRLGGWERSQCCLRNPPRGLWPFAQRNRKGTGETQARPPLPSHPGNPESFPFVCAWGFPGLSLPQASPCGCGSQVCGLGVSTPQGRAGWAGWGESRQHRLPRKTPSP